MSAIPNEHPPISSPPRSAVSTRALACWGGGQGEGFAPKTASVRPHAALTWCRGGQPCSASTASATARKRNREKRIPCLVKRLRASAISHLRQKLARMFCHGCTHGRWFGFSNGEAWSGATPDLVRAQYSFFTTEETEATQRAQRVALISPTGRSPAQCCRGGIPCRPRNHTVLRASRRRA